MNDDHCHYLKVKSNWQKSILSCPWPLFDMLDWIGNQPGGYEWAAELTVGQLIQARTNMEESHHKKTGKFLLELSKQIASRERSELLEELIREQEEHRKA